MSSQLLTSYRLLSGLRSSGLLLSVNWQLFKTTSQQNVNASDSEGLNYAAAEPWNLTAYVASEFLSSELQYLICAVNPLI